jgi:YVTN family beta-propeller protein
MKPSTSRFLVVILFCCFAVFVAGAAPMRAQYFAYVVNQTDATVSVIDTATNTVVATVPVGSNPQSVAVTPDGTYAYVVNSASNTSPFCPFGSNPGSVSVVSTLTNTVVATIPLGDAPAGVAIAPNGTSAYVTNYADSTISAIDTFSNTVTATIPGGPNPCSVAFTQRGAQAYVFDQGNQGKTISVINTATGAITTTISTAASGEGPIALSPDGATLYVPLGLGYVSVINTATNAVTTTWSLNNGSGGIDLEYLAVTPDGATAYVAAQGHNNVIVVPTATGVPSGTISVGSQPGGLALTPDGAYLYVANYGSGTVSVIQVSTNTVVGTINVGDQPIALAFARPRDYSLLNGGNTFNGNQTVNGNVSATNFVGNGTGLTNVTASGLNCAGCVGNSQLSINYAGSTSQGGSANNALMLGGLLPNAFQPAGSYATTGANLFSGDQNIVGNLSATGTLTGGGLVLPSTGTAIASQGFNSGAFDTFASVFNSTANAAQNQLFRWQAEPASNNSANPAATLNLLFGSNGATPSETGLSVNANGTINFTARQTFPSAGGGSGTITGVTAGTGLTGGGTSGGVTLSLASNACGPGDALTALPFTCAPFAGLGPNSFTGNQTVSGTVTATTFSGAFSGDGSSLTNVNAVSAITASTATNALALGGQPASFYATTGANTFSATQTMPGLQVNGTITSQSNSSANGVTGTTIGGVGVEGYANTGIGVQGSSANGAGVMGQTVSALPGQAAGIFNNQAFQNQSGNILLGQYDGTTEFTVDAKGDVTANGTITGSSFTGNGAGLTGVQASTLSPVTTIAGSQVSGAVANATNAVTAVNLTGNISDSQVNNLPADLAAASASAVTTAENFSSSTFLPLAGGTVTGNLAMTGGNLALSNTNGGGTSGVITLGGYPFLSNFGSANTFVGQGAGNFSMTGSSNAAFGGLSLSSNTSGRDNTASGYQALQSNTSGSQNAASGWQALVSNSTGVSNTAMGAGTLPANTSGGNNTAIGTSALEANINGGANTALGAAAGYTNTAANANTSGSYNTFIGFYSGPGTSTQLTNATAIGTDAVVSASNAMVLGSINGVNGATSNVNVGIGTATPGYALDVENGQVNASGGLCIANVCQTSWPSGQLGTVTNIATGAGLTGGPITSTGTISVANGGITNTMLASGSVTSTDIAAGSIVDANVSAAAAINPTKINGTAAVLGANTFTGTQTMPTLTVTGNATVTQTGSFGSVTAGSVAVNSSDAGGAVISGVNNAAALSFGVIGSTSSSGGAGVSGTNSTGVGVSGESNSSYGIYGQSASNSGIFGLTSSAANTTAVGIFENAASTNTGNILLGQYAANGSGTPVNEFVVDAKGDVTANGNVAAAGTVTIGSGGTPIVKHLSQVFTSFTIPAITPANCATLAPFTLTGASDGDTVAFGIKNDLITAAAGYILDYFGWVSGANTITIRVCNPRGPSNPALTGSATNTIRVDVWKH